MFLEAILYFVLGFLCAGLLALMVSPLIWNRAVVLTKHKIESSVPLTLNEIQAEKDQLRAEFAMSTRKLEINVEQLRDRLAAQSIEVNQKRDEVSKLDFDNKEYSKNVDVLRDEKVALVAQINERSAEFDKVKGQFDNLNTTHGDVTSEVQELRDRLADKEELVNSQRIEIAAKNTKIDALSETAKRYEINDENAHVEEVQKLSRALSDQREHNVNLEAKLASHALAVESVAENATDKNIQNAVDVLKDNLKVKSDKIASIEKERDALIDEVKALSSVTKEEWASERKNSAILRERINDMAAKVAVLTQEIEGETSPIPELVAQEPVSKRKRGAKSSGSLAERIRALQETASAT